MANAAKFEQAVGMCLPNGVAYLYCASNGEQKGYCRQCVPHGGRGLASARGRVSVLLACCQLSLATPANRQYKLLWQDPFFKL